MSKKKSYDIIIVGAGASGMAAAIAAGAMPETDVEVTAGTEVETAAGMTAGANAWAAGQKILLIDRQEKMGRKILATGNGKCNLTNRHQEPSCYRSEQPERAWDIVSSFGRKRTDELFDSLGIYVRERDGYVYPYSEQAASVREAFEEKILANPNITFLSETIVRRAEAVSGGFRIFTETGTRIFTETGIKPESGAGSAKKSGLRSGLKSGSPKKSGSGQKSFSGIYFAKKLIIAAGGFAGREFGCDGSGYALAESFGHHIVKPLPALTALKSSAPFLKKVKGVRNQARITLEINGKEAACEQGELQWTDYGISGVAVFQLSRFAVTALDAGKKVVLYLDFMPELTREEKKSLLLSMAEANPNRRAPALIRGLFPEKLIPVILREAKIPEELPAKNFSKKEWKALLDAISCFSLRINGYAGYEKAQVTRGGVSLDELDDNLESRLHPGLFFTGETVDVDGTCGGYNLQWAFASGSLAGKAARDDIRE